MKTDASILPVVALVGRPNVGKSSLFNRLTRSREALVDDTPGLTRDRHYGRIVWPEATLHVVDTGGFEPKSVEILPNLMREQTLVAIEESDLVVFVTDGQTGPLPDDHTIADLLRRADKPVICAVNKTEGKGGVESACEFYGLGLGPVLAISAAHGRGMEGLRLAIVESLTETGWLFGNDGGEAIVTGFDGGIPIEEREEEGDGGRVFSTVPSVDDPADDPAVRVEGDGQTREESCEPSWEGAAETDGQVGETNGPGSESAVTEPVAVAVVGCPNAGKSSLINALLGENRLIASEVAGTTRDAIDLPFVDRHGRSFTLIDTAGIRRKSRISLRIEKFSVMAALRAVDRADVAVLVLDAQRAEISDQDRRVATLAIEAGCGLVMVVNKWDTVSGGRQEQKNYLHRLREAFPLFPHAPILFISATRGKGIETLLETVHRVWRLSRQRISTGRLNRWLNEALEKHPPPRSAGRAVKIRYMTQVATQPPTLLIFANRPDRVHETYRRYLENQFRLQFEFPGVPVRVLFRKGENPYEQKSGR